MRVSVIKIYFIHNHYVKSKVIKVNLGLKAMDLNEKRTCYVDVNVGEMRHIKDWCSISWKQKQNHEGLYHCGNIWMVRFS